MIYNNFSKTYMYIFISWYLITGVSLYRLNLGLILISKRKFQEKRRLGLLHQFEKSAAVVVTTFRLGIIARKMHNGSWGTNNSKLFLFKIFSCKLFSNYFSFNRQILFWLLSPSFHQFLQEMVRPMKARPKPTTRSLFCQQEQEEESETEFFKVPNLIFLPLKRFKRLCKRFSSSAN